jgi:hypothetical protein
MSQVVIASYTVQSVFKVPKGVNIEKLMKENRAYVKWDILHLCIEGDVEDEKNWIEIEAYSPASEFDFKRPSNNDFEIDELSNWPGYGSEEEEEEKETDKKDQKEPLEDVKLLLEREYGEIDVKGFENWVDGMDRDDLIRCLWNRCSLKEKLEMYYEKDEEN